MYITAQGCRLQNDLYCVEWDVKLYYTIPYHLFNQAFTEPAASPSRVTTVWRYRNSIVIIIK